jgi:hypothetical protein
MTKSHSEDVRHAPIAMEYVEAYPFRCKENKMNSYTLRTAIFLGGVLTAGGCGDSPTLPTRSQPTQLQAAQTGME